MNMFEYLWTCLNIYEHVWIFKNKYEYSWKRGIISVALINAFCCHNYRIVRINFKMTDGLCKPEKPTIVSIYPIYNNGSRAPETIFDVKKQININNNKNNNNNSNN